MIGLAGASGLQGAYHLFGLPSASYQIPHSRPSPSSKLPLSSPHSFCLRRPSYYSTHTQQAQQKYSALSLLLLLRPHSR